MKKILSFLTLIVFTNVFHAQVGIGTTSPDPSAQLDITATDKGVLIPRLSLSDVSDTSLDGTTTAATGLLIFNTNATVTGGSGTGYYYFDGTVWERLSTSTSGTDHDFYEEGTTTSPDDISDDIYTLGNVGIGQSSVFYPLDINFESDRAINIFKTTASVGTSHGMYVTIANDGVNYGSRMELSNFDPTGLSYGNYATVFSGDGTAYGFYSELNCIGGVNGNGYGTYNHLTGNLTNIYGVYNLIQPTVGSIAYGNYNDFYDIIMGYGLYNRFRNASQDLYGVYNSFGSSTALSGNNYSIYTTMQGVESGNLYGAYTLIGNGGDGDHYGGYHLLNGSGDGNQYGLYQEFASPPVAPSALTYGVYNNFVGSKGSFQYGVYNEFQSPNNLELYGMNNEFLASGNGIHRGISNLLGGSGSGQHIGIDNVISGVGTGEKVGTRNYLDGAGFMKFGSKNLIADTASGELYGVYAEVLRSTGVSYAGYFLGKVAIGDSQTTNYILPLTRGSNGQIMQTDGAGNVSWVAPTGLGEKAIIKMGISSSTSGTDEVESNLILNTVSYNYGGGSHDPATGTYTIPYDGVYEITANLNYLFSASPLNSAVCVFRVYVNGFLAGQISSQKTTVNASRAINYTYSLDLEFSAGDDITFRFLPDYGPGSPLPSIVNTDTSVVVKKVY
ncbi:hypothetical protein [Luteirhabdus pelagi]|uniref:hypothetical protein n=1 Tax=Luteirhabdus pelagi TaxID=2792783 RepID=UPI001939B407|nr:hypothetical protein [Luteirhabdus pelagi]